MSRARRWVLATAGLLVATVVVLVGAFFIWLPSEQEAVTKIEAEFQQRMGVGLEVQRVHWKLWPTPTLVIEDAATRQDKPITIRYLALEAPWRAIIDRSVQVTRLQVDGAAVPVESLREFRGREDDAAGAAKAWTLAPIPVEHVAFRDVTWIDRRGIELLYDGEADFDTAWRPHNLRIARSGATPPAQLKMEREKDEDRWRVLIDVGGGTWNGSASLQSRDDGHLALTAQLEPKNIDVESLANTFKRSAIIAGRANGKSDVTAEGDSPGAMLRNLHTHTRFSVKPAKLTRFDLAKAVRTAGVSRGGQTPLDELTGTLDTQSTGEGVVFSYKDMRARSGVLTATGSVKLFNRKLDGEAAVDIVDGVVGVPLKISGTTQQPELSLTGGALAGAAVGSAVLPGVGTAIGARIGQQVERIFGDGGKNEGDKKKSGQSPAASGSQRR